MAAVPAAGAQPPTLNSQSGVMILATLIQGFFSS